MARGRYIGDDGQPLLDPRMAGLIPGPGGEPAYGTRGYWEYGPSVPMGSNLVQRNGKTWIRSAAPLNNPELSGYTFEGRPLNSPEFSMYDPEEGWLTRADAQAAVPKLNEDLWSVLGPGAAMAAFGGLTGLHGAAVGAPSLPSSLGQATGFTTSAPAAVNPSFLQNSLAQLAGPTTDFNMAAAANAGDLAALGGDRFLNVMDAVPQNLGGIAPAAGGGLPAWLSPAASGASAAASLFGPTASLDDMIAGTAAGGGVQTGGIGTSAQEAALAEALGTGGLPAGGTSGVDAIVDILQTAGVTPTPGMLETIVNGLKNVFGGGGLSGLNGLMPTGGGLNPLDLSARLAPGLLALNYARNTSPLDTGRLESLYAEAGDSSLNPNLLPYDLQTGQGREKLTSNLARRGVLGSSFGNFDLSSYDTLRGLGRSSLLGQGLQQRVGIAGNILNAQAQSQALKNALYGRAFDVLGRGLSPGPSLYLAGA